MVPLTWRKRSSNGNNESSEQQTELEEKNSNSSLLIVILSLVFVAIFGCALVGGVISGDPTNGFLITIIVASTIAISVAMGVSIRYIYMNRTRDNDDDRYLSKENMRGTLSSSDEENQYDEEPPHNQTHTYFPNTAAVEPKIKEIQAKSIVGDMSALSTQSYDDDSLSFRHHIIRDHHKKDRQGFGSFKLTQSDNKEHLKIREDPPEGFGLATIQAAWMTRGIAQDPSAPKFSTDGEIIGNESDSQIQHMSDSQSTCTFTEDKLKVSVNSVPSENDTVKKDGTDNTLRSDNDEKSTTHSTSKSPSASSSTKSPSVTSTTFRKSKNGKNDNAIEFPSSTKSAPIKSSFASKMLPTPAASEVGSLASSFFNMLGKTKESRTGVRASDVIDSNEAPKKPRVKKVNAPPEASNRGKAHLVRPPMLPPINRKGREITKIADTRSDPPPSTPGNKSGFTIPPPRPIPRTPMGSEVFSEFQSLAGSVAVSSTFDPEAHQRALEKIGQNQKSIGASPIDVNSMPAYYNDEDKDENENENSVAPSSFIESSALSYDVFAPPGALGIVVDTTKKGCIVYSLKKSSPMQGLMSRGDLIIGLDNFDVRKMNASSLTKLMAKKSEQAERKFTLLPNAS
mmetsp:Transcript_12047/g.28559  ORF Transcript_12047/g.28559 Transcript_12047/m.28559 type:complete len:625 (-) Transcript_12047:96-1970(-)